MEPSFASQALGVAAFTLLALTIRAAIVYARNKIARSAVEPPRASAERCTNGQWCQNHGHYFRKAFADMWRCVNCGHLQPVSADEVLDIAAEDFRGELDHVEAFANGEVGA